MSKPKTISQRFKEAIEEYSGLKVKRIEIYRDPKVDDCYAARVKCEGVDDYLYFLKTAHDALTADSIEEAEFEGGWPPKSGNLKFF